MFFNLVHIKLIRLTYFKMKLVLLIIHARGNFTNLLKKFIKKLFYKSIKTEKINLISLFLTEQ